jgi:hypothetical protein
MQPGAVSVAGWLACKVAVADVRPHTNRLTRSPLSLRMAVTALGAPHMIFTPVAARCLLLCHAHRVCLAQVWPPDATRL